MPRIRTIKPEFFTDRTMGRLGPIAALVYAALWCWADDGGVAMCDADRLKAEVFSFWPAVTEGSVSESLRLLEGSGRIRRYRVGEDGYCHITKFLSHQKINRPSKVRFPRPLREPSVSPHGALTDGRETEGKGKGGEAEGSAPKQLTNELHRAAYEHFHGIARNPDAFAAEVRAQAEGMPGHTSGKPFGWLAIGRALHDLLVDGGDCTPLRLRVFAEKVRDLPDFTEPVEEVTDDLGRSIPCKAVDGWWVSVATGERIAPTEGAA